VLSLNEYSVCFRKTHNLNVVTYNTHLHFLFLMRRYRIISLYLKKLKNNQVLAKVFFEDALIRPVMKFKDRFSKQFICELNFDGRVC
jgi:hypothetical protein